MGRWNSRGIPIVSYLFFLYVFALMMDGAMIWMRYVNGTLFFPSLNPNGCNKRIAYCSEQAKVRGEF